ncbi:hypothetical protein HanPI659440_Chr13g0487841 [Helianthus annuus]|nr:hypothetical protein HanPI659440_Chr13g0487841 [Helianthus annuus]
MYKMVISNTIFKMAYEESVKIYNFFVIFFHLCPSPLTRPLSSPPKNLSHAFSFQLQMKRLGFRWFPSPPLLSIIPIQIGEKERVGERWSYKRRKREYDGSGR